MQESIIDIKGLSKTYKLYDKPSDRLKETFKLGKKNYSREFHALSNIDFDVKKGETVGIIGKNGAGKSTLLKIITGVLTPTEGKAEINGKISALLELGAGFNQEYSGLENIYLNGRMMGYTKKEMDERVESIIEFADIGEFIYQPVKTYSSGMFARLAFAVAINVEPDILIVDEALSVGDVFFQNKCFRKFEELKEKNVTILFVSHDIASVRQMCSRVLWLDRGTQKIFDESTLVCDMYMDAKRQEMNEHMDIQNVEADAVIVPEHMEEDVIYYPGITQIEERFKSEKLEVISFFIKDENGKIVKNMSVDQKYKAYIVMKFLENEDGIIAGFIFENNKGLPLYDINNYINQQQTIEGKKGQTIEVSFDYMLPRIMKGTYIVSIGISKGTQEKSAVVSWLHGVTEIVVENPGYNSSYIEIPSHIEVKQIENEKVRIV